MTPPSSVEGHGRLRLFCALRLPETTLDALEQWQAEHLRGRFVPRANLHLTLAFLGSRPAGELGTIAQALRAAAGCAMQPIFRAVGYRETRTVGMLVLDDEDGRATQLAGDLHERLEAAGLYRREARPWLPHVTVLRFRARPRLRPPVPDLGVFSPSDAAVYHSALSPDGAQYSVLETAPLGG
jgi:RNA 2',3'-cyclic 3'-phosphodiesterase